MIVYDIIHYYLLKNCFNALFLFFIMFEKRTGFGTGIENQKENFRNLTRTSADNFIRTGPSLILSISAFKNYIFILYELSVFQYHNLHIFDRLFLYYIILQY